MFAVSSRLVYLITALIMIAFITTFYDYYQYIDYFITPIIYYLRFFYEYLTHYNSQLFYQHLIMFVTFKIILVFGYKLFKN